MNAVDKLHLVERHQVALLEGVQQYLGLLSRKYNASSLFDNEDVL